MLRVVGPLGIVRDPSHVLLVRPLSPMGRLSRPHYATVKEGRRAKKIVFCRAWGLLIIVSLQEPEDAPLSKGVAAQEQACNSTSMKFKSIYRSAIRF